MSKISIILESLLESYGDSLSSLIPQDIKKQKDKELKPFYKLIFDIRDIYQKTDLSDVDGNLDFYKQIFSLLTKAKNTVGFNNLPLNILEVFYKLNNEIIKDSISELDYPTNPYNTKKMIDFFLELIDEYSNELL